MKKSKTNVSVVSNVGIRRNVNVHVGDNGSFPSGDILDANATKQLVDNVADSVRAITDMAPEDFDTLKEAADAITSLLSSMPTKVSDLENDVSYITEDEMKVEGVDTNGHDYVEIAGIKWATMNVGATSETDYGLYFQWGDTQGYTASQVGSGEGQKAFGWADYKYGNGTSSPGAAGMTKYNSTDGKTELDLEDDAARANWGGAWRMPTTSELQALGNAVNAVWTTNYNGSGVNGLLCTDKSDSTKTLFFPTAGVAGNGSVYSVGYEDGVWSSSLISGYVDNAWCLRFSSGVTNWGNGYSRYLGFSVRGVLDTGKVDKYAAKQELDAEVRRAQAVEATKANTADLATVATTGSYNDLTNKPTIPNVAVVNLEIEDIDTSTNPYTITNQDKISLICDLIDAKTYVTAELIADPMPPSQGFYLVVPTFDENFTLKNVNLFVLLFIPNPNDVMIHTMAYADVTSRYATSNTGS